MKTISTQAIVLKRSNYREADRILRVITPDRGKISLIAKAVRKPKSKLAGGIELFSVNEISYIEGKSDLSTLVSSRAEKHYKDIILDIDRTMSAYDFIATIDNSLEDQSGQEFYQLLNIALGSINNLNISLELTETWFIANFLDLGGRSPNLMTDRGGVKLSPNANYAFDAEDMVFVESANGIFEPSHIKFARLMTHKTPQQLSSVIDSSELLPEVYNLYKSIYKNIN